MVKKMKQFFWRSAHAYYKILPSLHPRNLYLPLNKIKIIKPIFLIGVQGGGLTIISRSIKRSKNVVSMRGNYKYWTGQDELASQKDIPKEISLLYPENGKSPVYNELFGNERQWWSYATNELVKKYYSDEKSYTKKLDLKIKNLIKTFIRGYSININNARYCEKSQLFSLKIKLLKKIFPDAKFVLIFRNPYAICYRIAVKNYAEYKDGKIKELDLNQRLKIASEHWKNNFEIALNDLEELNLDYYKIKIEDYLKNPKKYLKEILEYCELEFNEDLLPSPNHKLPFGSLDEEKWYPIKNEINKKYLDKLSKVQKTIIKKEIGEKLLKRIGY